jgi:hypothetical protein
VVYMYYFHIFTSISDGLSEAYIYLISKFTHLVNVAISVHMPFSIAAYGSAQREGNSFSCNSVKLLRGVLNKL